MPSTCFIVHDPKMREIFAANFRDRIVHHLFYNYTYELFKRTFISDSYSCIKGRGTHYGIERLKHHIRSVSRGYSQPCFVLKIDIKEYFMHINRKVLLSLCRNTLYKMMHHSSSVFQKKWSEVLDLDFVDYLLDTVLDFNPVDHCIMLGLPEDWKNLPPTKSLFFSDIDCGLPIGNLSSQLFSNIYMNVFDHFIKRQLHCKHYGRYVDDAFIVSNSKEQLRALIPRISTFLKDVLYLEINTDKLKIENAYYGVEFLGAYLKPFRTYISHSTLIRIKRKIMTRKYENVQSLNCSVNSFLGVFSHYDSYRLRRVLFGNCSNFNLYGTFSRDFLLYSSKNDGKIR